MPWEVAVRMAGEARSGLSDTVIIFYGFGVSAMVIVSLQYGLLFREMFLCRLCA